MIKGLIKFVVFGCIGLTILGAILNAAGIGKNQPGSTLRATLSPGVTSQTQQGTEPTQAPQATEAPKETEAPAATAAPLSVKDQVEAAARKVCGDRLVSVQFGGTTLVKCKLGENFTEDMTVGGTVIDLLDMVKAVMPHAEVQTLRLQIIGQFKDKYGNKSDGIAFNFAMSQPLYKKINWGNMHQREFAKLMADGTDGSSAFIHQAWREAWATYLRG